MQGGVIILAGTTYPTELQLPVMAIVTTLPNRKLLAKSVPANAIPHLIEAIKQRPDLAQ